MNGHPERLPRRERALGLFVIFLIALGIGGQGFLAALLWHGHGFVPGWAAPLLAVVGPPFGAWEGDRVSRYFGLRSSDPADFRLEARFIEFILSVLMTCCLCLLLIRGITVVT